MPEPIKCVRCRQPLPEGSGFCVSCGHNNEALLLERKVKVVRQANERIGFWKSIREFFRIFRGR